MREYLKEINPDGWDTFRHLWGVALSIVIDYIYPLVNKQFAIENGDLEWIYPARK